MNTNNLPFYIILLVLLGGLISCSRPNVDTSTPEITLLSFVQAVNSKNSYAIDSTTTVENCFSILSTNNEFSALEVVEYETVTQNAFETVLRVWFKTLSNKGEGFDKLFFLRKREQDWNIYQIKDFTYTAPSELSNMSVLSLIFGESSDFNLERDVALLIRDNNIINVFSTSYGVQSQAELGSMQPADMHFTTLYWNGVTWAKGIHRESIYRYLRGNGVDFTIKQCFFKKNDNAFFLVNGTPFVSDFSEVKPEFMVFDLEGKCILEAQVSLPDSYEFYYYQLKSVTLDGKKFSGRGRVGANDKMYHLELLDERTGELQGEGGVILDPQDKNNILFHGDWYFSYNDTKATYVYGRKQGVQIVDLSNMFRNTTPLTTCQRCRLGHIVNGFCDMCGVPSKSKLEELNENLQESAMTSSALNCPNRSNHHSYRYPYECPYCTYRGLFK